jgi:hypothetical protein
MLWSLSLSGQRRLHLSRRERRDARGGHGQPLERCGQFACRSEWRLKAVKHNLSKLWRHTTALQRAGSGRPPRPAISTPVIKRLSDRRLRITVHVHPSARGTWQVRATRAGRTYIKRVQRTRWTTAVTVARARHPEADRRVRRAPRLEGRPLPPPPAARAVAPRSTGRRTTCARHTARDLLHGRGRFCFACQGAGQGDRNGTTAFACLRHSRLFRPRARVGRQGVANPSLTRFSVRTLY